VSDEPSEDLDPEEEDSDEPAPEAVTLVVDDIHLGSHTDL
jgi:hypothetical protein